MPDTPAPRIAPHVAPRICCTPGGNRHEPQADRVSATHPAPALHEAPGRNGTAAGAAGGDREGRNAEEER